MQRLFLALFGLLSSATLAQAADKITFEAHYMCLNTVVSGLNWEHGSWAAHTYAPLGMFQMEIMIVETVFPRGDKHQFIHFTLDGDSEHSHCGMETNSVSIVNDYSCVQVGETFVFSTDTSRGGISRLLGSVSTENTRDSLMVAPFTCQKR